MHLELKASKFLVRAIKSKVSKHTQKIYSGPISMWELYPFLATIAGFHRDEEEDYKGNYTNHASQTPCLSIP